MREISTLVFLVISLAAAIGDARMITNGLSSSGDNVCQRTYYKAEQYYAKVYRTDYTTYSTSCGWHGLSRCARSRTNRVSYYTKRTRSVAETLLYCCHGWKQTGDGCKIPICSRGCSHGSCVGPDKCNCSSGWTGPTCSDDINGCLLNNGGCQQQCINKLGPGIECSCLRGYTRHGTRCDDINECNVVGFCKCGALSSDNICGAHCNNTIGGFKCSCGNGYKLIGTTVCVDENECASGTSRCSHRCINLAGTYKCSCPSGFLLIDNRRCTDVDECQGNSGFCEQKCQNAIGTFSCTCRTGFVLDGNRRTCSDIDECKYAFNECETRCHNTPGGYYCSCTKGYEVAPDNKTCVDVDECAIRPIVGTNKTASLADCHQVCINTDASFRCDCRNGYVLMYDKKRCQDIDECATGKHQCDHTCHNTEGSYKCTCSLGYRLGSNGKTCEGLPCQMLNAPPHGQMKCTGRVTKDNCTFTCYHGYSITGPTVRTCQPSSSWSGKRTICKPKQCAKLSPSRLGESLLAPCYRTYGSICHFRCSKGFYLEGNSSATCSLITSSEDVHWKIGNFSCKEIQTCRPNPCNNGGKCAAIDENQFLCNCKETGFSGRFCEIGVVTIPEYPKLEMNSTSHPFSLKAYPSNELTVSLTTNDDIKIEPTSLLQIRKPSTSANFVVKTQTPGIKVISYSADSSDSKNFAAPKDSILFVSPQKLLAESIYTRMPLAKGDLPLGCYAHPSKELSCDTIFVSTTQWKSAFTTGLVQLHGSGGIPVPLSLIGIDLQDVSLSRKRLIENTVQMTSKLKEEAASIDNGNGQCSVVKTGHSDLLELIDHSSVSSSFLRMLSERTPGWFDVSINEDSKDFDISNIQVNLAREALKVPQFSTFPFSKTSSIAYQCPNIKYSLRVESEELSTSTGNGGCFAVDICKISAFIHFSPSSKNNLKLLKVFKDMKDKDMEITTASIGFIKDGEMIHVVKGRLWNGKDLFNLQPFQYNLWLRGEMMWMVQIPHSIKLSIHVQGQAFLQSQDIENLFVDRLTSKLDLALLGKTDINITSRALMKDYKMKITSTKSIGKALFGASPRERQCATTQGIFLNLEGAGNLFEGTPLHLLIKPSQNQPIFLVIFLEATGGEQNQVLNLASTRSSLTYFRFLMRQLEGVLEDAKQFTPGIQEKLKTWSHFAKNTSILLGHARTAFLRGRANDDVKILVQLAKRIDAHLRFVRSFSSILKNRLARQASNFQVSDLIMQLEDIINGLPQAFRLTLRGKEVTQKLHGISIFMPGTVCIKRVCFDDIDITVKDFIEDSCSSKRNPTIAFYVSGIATKSNSLGFGLNFPKGRALSMTIQRESGQVVAFIEAEVRLLALKQILNVAVNGEEMFFKTEGLIFGRHMTSLSVNAETNSPELATLVYHVTGKMNSSSELAVSLENRIESIVKSLAETSQRKVKNTIEALKSARRRREEAEKLSRQKEQALVKARTELQTAKKMMMQSYLSYAVAKEALNASLIYSIRQQNEVCEFKTCGYKPTVVCVPKLCQDNVTFSYYIPNCTKSKETVMVDKLVSTTVTESYTEPTWRLITYNSCTGYYQREEKRARFGASIASRVTATEHVDPTWGFGLEDVKEAATGCDVTSWTEKGKPKTVNYFNYIMTRELVEKTVSVFKCGNPVRKTVQAGYERPYECCNNDTVDILDVDCVLYNDQCATNNSKLRNAIRAENATLVKRFQEMMRHGERANIAQLKVTKARAQLGFTTKQYELAKAKFKQQKYAEGSINITKVNARESLGLKLNEKIQNRGVTKLVKVQNLYFETSLDSGKQTLFPFSVSLQTTDGEGKVVKLPIDFARLEFSVDSAANHIVRHLYGESVAKRRRRSTNSFQQIKEDENERMANDSLKSDIRARDHCLLARDANLYFTEIVDSLVFVIRSKNILAREMEQRVQELKDLSPKNNTEHPTNSHNREAFTEPKSESMRSVYEDILEVLKQEQMQSNASSWSDTLEDWKGFLEIFSEKKSFLECSGTGDCVNFFFDQLWNLYRFEDETEALEIKKNLQGLQDGMNNLTHSSYSLTDAVSMTSQLLALLNKTKDHSILCGRKPDIWKSPPQEILALTGGALNLSCDAFSKTQVRYHWKKNGKRIETNTKTSGIITFHNISLKDEGAYRCEVSNNRGKTISNVTIVRVHSRPRMTEQPQDIKVKSTSKEMAYFVCNATGKPQPGFQWYFVTQKGDTERKISLNVSKPVLVIENATYSDNGQYYCRASNIHGQVQSRKARLYVLEFGPATPRISVAFNVTSKSQSNSSVDGQSNNTRDKDGNAPILFDREDLYLRNRTTKLIAQRLHLSNQNDIKHVQFISGPVARVSFIVDSHPQFLSHKEEDIFNEFATSRTKLGKRVRSFYQALQAAQFAIPWKEDFSIVGRADSLFARFPRPKCPGGQEADSNGFLCVNCAPGSYSQDEGRCTPCPVGTYQPHQGQSTCLPCDKYTTTASEGSLTKSKCFDIYASCNPPHMPLGTNIQLSAKKREQYRHKDTVNLGCGIGYKMVGRPMGICDNGTWTFSEFNCRKTCMPPWKELNEHCYQLIDQPIKAWQDAQQKCHALGAHLPIIDSEEENNFVFHYAQTSRHKRMQLWLGMHRRADDTLQWVDGTPVGHYTNWIIGEPSNYGGNEDCGEMLVNGKYRLKQWNDITCSPTRFMHMFMCEKPLL